MVKRKQLQPARCLSSKNQSFYINNNIFATSAINFEFLFTKNHPSRCQNSLTTPIHLMDGNICSDNSAECQDLFFIIKYFPKNKSKRSLSIASNSSEEELTAGYALPTIQGSDKRSASVSLSFPSSSENSCIIEQKKKICISCKTKKTPYWREGWNKGVSLCNACGIRYQKYKKYCSTCFSIVRKDEKGKLHCPECQAML
jgi:hypothetical protein